MQNGSLLLNHQIKTPLPKSLSLFSKYKPLQPHLNDNVRVNFAQEENRKMIHTKALKHNKKKKNAKNNADFVDIIVFKGENLPLVRRNPLGEGSNDVVVPKAFCEVSMVSPIMDFRKSQVQTFSGSQRYIT